MPVRRVTLATAHGEPRVQVAARGNRARSLAVSGGAAVGGTHAHANSADGYNTAYEASMSGTGSSLSR